MTPCATCPKLRGPVPSSGPRPCRFLFIGEAPHKSEDRIRIPFAGPTGRELDNYYLPISGLFRPDVAITNARLCSNHLYRNPEPSEGHSCASHHLPATIVETNPEYIVAMGAVACSLFRTKDGPISVVTDHGIPTIAALDLPGARHPLTGERFRWVGVVIPIYHPSAALHDSNVRYHLQRDFPILKQVAAGLEGHPVTPWPVQDYRLVEGASHVQRVLADIDAEGDGYVGVDTEVDLLGFDLEPLRDPPWCLSFSGICGRAYTIMAEDRQGLDAFTSWVNRRRPRLVIHNALFDVPILERMEVVVQGGRGIWSLIEDTMMRAYHTGWMEQSLKVCAYRYLGLRMSDYADVVEPHAIAPQVKYLLKVAKAKPKDVPQPYLKPRQHKLPRKAKALAERALDKGELPQTGMKRNWLPKQPLDIEVMEEHFGPFPYCSIRHAPFDEAVYYACQDADAARMLRPVIKRELVEIQRRVRF